MTHSTRSGSTEMTHRGDTADVKEELKSQLVQFRNELSALRKVAEGRDEGQDLKKREADIYERCLGAIQTIAPADIATQFQKVCDPRQDHSDPLFDVETEWFVLERIDKGISRIEYAINLIGICDQLVHGWSFKKQRSDLLVDDKTNLLLQKLALLKRVDRYHSADLIFALCEVQMDNEAEATSIVQMLAKKGLVEFPDSWGSKVVVRITSAGKRKVEMETKARPRLRSSTSIKSIVGLEFIDTARIQEIEGLKHQFDFARLVQYCKEINDNYARGNYLSVGILCRAVINHIPPVFNSTNFSQVVAGCKMSSGKKNLERLSGAMKDIADGINHDHISKKETLPNSTTVNFRPEFDVLLSYLIKTAGGGHA